MKTQNTFSDEELTAYLDGEYKHTRADEIKRALDDDANLRDRLAQLSLNNRELKSAFDELLMHTPAYPADKLANPSQWKLTNSVIAATAVVFFIIGISIKSILPTTDGITSWQDYAAIYQALYINSTLSHIDHPKEVMTEELERISLALGKEISLSKMNSMGQLNYKRAQILGFRGQPLIQLAFLSSVDVPIALCIMRSEEYRNSDIKIAEIEGMSAASWEKEGFSYFLIGGKDPMLIKDAANKFAAVL